MPTNTMLPHVVYPDVAEAIPWLTKTFGSNEHYRHGNSPDGAQMHLEGEHFAGHYWLFSRHARDVNPADWGAKVAKAP